MGREERGQFESRETSREAAATVQEKDDKVQNYLVAAGLQWMGTESENLET